jgi:hypothetical protein
MRKAIILTEHTTNGDDQSGELLSDGAGRMLRGLCERQGINLDEVLVHPIFKEAGSSIFKYVGPQSQGIPQSKSLMSKKYIKAEYAKDLTATLDLLKTEQPNLIIGMGQLPLWLLTGERSLRKYRGSPIQSEYGKIIATYSARSVQADFKLRPIIEADFAKCGKEQEFAGVRRPQRELWIDPTLEDLRLVNDRILNCDMLSVDIETKTPQITHVGFATDPSFAIVVPFYTREKPSRNYWSSHSEEVRAWGYVRNWCLNAKKIVGQNFNYDMAYLWQEYGIALPNATEDTMLMQHAQQPEMEKGLGFLGSLHSNEPQWKFMRANKDTTKKED